MSDHRVAKRHKWRLACEVVSEGRSQRAIVIDLSTTGIFVQTGTRVPPGSEVEVRLLLPDATEPILLRAKVARNKQVPPQLTSVARGGVGLRILEAPTAYYETIGSLEGGDSPRQPNAVAAPEPDKSALPRTAEAIGWTPLAQRRDPRRVARRGACTRARASGCGLGSSHGRRDRLSRMALRATGMPSHAVMTD